MPSRQKAVYAAIFALLLIVPAIRIASTWRVFSQTADEGMHLAAGFQLLDSGRYLYDVGHPPLVRVLCALPAYLTGATAGAPPPASIDPLGECVWVGNQLLYRGGNDHYRHNLAMARVGNLPFFLLAAVVLFLWTRRLFGTPTALVALALFGALPSILAHAGLVTTDMGATATVLAALYFYVRWLERRSWQRTLPLGIAIGIGLITKFSIIVFFPVGAAVLTAAWLLRAGEHGAWQWRPLLRQILLAGAAVALIVWSGYRFSIGTWNSAAGRAPWDLPASPVERYQAVPGYEWVRQDLIDDYYRYAHDAERVGKTGIDFVDWAKAAGYPSPLAGRHGDTMKDAPPLPPRSKLEPARALAHRLTRSVEPWWRGVKRQAAVSIVLPAPAFFTGVDTLARHSDVGHPGFLLGEYRDRGWWYYFPVVLFFKTPLAFQLLALGGMVWLIATSWSCRRWEPLGVALVPLAMLVPAMTSGINIGIRHVQPIEPFLAITAAAAVSHLWSLPARLLLSRICVVVLLLWFFTVTARAHPDYLPYFNELAGSHPEEIAIDSNFDWGQDGLRLCHAINRENLPRVWVSYWGSAEWRRCTAAGIELPPAKPVTGWVAISEMNYRFGGKHLRGEDFAWLRRYEPVRRIGRSIRLYYIP